jgi:HAE1 family hydrophobic/amphiphilic exporter-1/multidrug efflux pump
MQAIGQRLLDESYQTSLSGPSRIMRKVLPISCFAFVLALMLIYLVLSAQFLKVL